MYVFARAAVRAAGDLRRKNKKNFTVGMTLMQNNFPLAPARGSLKKYVFARANAVMTGEGEGTARAQRPEQGTWNGEHGTGNPEPRTVGPGTGNR